jgi:hypothetical protein
MIHQEEMQAEGQPEEAPVAQEQEAAPEKSKFRSKAVTAVPENLRDAFERVVLAGQKIMFAKEMQDDIAQELQREGETFKKLAEAVLGLIGLIAREAKGKVPPEVVVPAAIELLHEAAAFAQESGKIEVSPEELKQATQYLVILMLKGQGASDQEIEQAFVGNEQETEQGSEQPEGAGNGVILSA